MRVLHVHAGNMYGGTERVIETVARERAACSRMEPAFALCFDGRLEQQLRTIGVPVDMLGPVRFSRPDQVVRARRRLAAILQRDRPDVIVTQSVWTHAVFAPVVRRARVPLAIWLHDLLSGDHWLEKRARRWQPDLLICNSGTTEAAARNVFPDAPAAIVHGPISMNAASPNPDHESAVSAPGPEVVIAHVGRMVALKGHRILIDALATLPPEPRWACWFIGGPQAPDELSYEQELRAKVAALGLQDRIRFVGSSEDVMGVLRRAHIYCQPNEQPESFGLTLVEALQAGLPVVAFAFGGATEIVTESCGRLVEPGNVAALTDTLRWLIESAADRETLGANGPARARALCDPATCLSRVLAALHDARSTVAA